MLTLRKATIQDLAILQHWDKQAHIIAADPDDDWNWAVELPRNPEWREQLITTLDGRPIGFIQIIDPYLEETHYWGDIEVNKRAIDIWIGEKEDLGKGYGTQMMQLSLGQCFDNQSITEVLVDPLASNKRAINFYKKIGFRFVEKRKFGADDCEIYTLTRAHWKMINK